MFGSWNKQQKEVELTSDERSIVSQQRAVNEEINSTTNFGVQREEENQ